eukprot:Colp12_sorted_trinity150504_noHs@25103
MAGVDHRAKLLLIFILSVLVGFLVLLCSKLTIYMFRKKEPIWWLFDGLATIIRFPLNVFLFASIVWMGVQNFKKPKVRVSLFEKRALITFVVIFVIVVSIGIVAARTMTTSNNGLFNPSNLSEETLTYRLLWCCYFTASLILQYIVPFFVLKRSFIKGAYNAYRAQQESLHVLASTCDVKTEEELAYDANQDIFTTTDPHFHMGNKPLVLERQQTALIRKGWFYTKEDKRMGVAALITVVIILAIQWFSALTAGGFNFLLFIAYIPVVCLLLYDRKANIRGSYVYICLFATAQGMLAGSLGGSVLSLVQTYESSRTMVTIVLLVFAFTTYCNGKLLIWAGVRTFAQKKNGHCNPTAGYILRLLLRSHDFHERAVSVIPFL